MADFTARDLRNDAIQELRDTEQRKWKDPEFAVYINQAIRFTKWKIQQLNKYGTVPEEFPRVYLPYEEFSSDNCHDLPTNFMEKI